MDWLKKNTALAAIIAVTVLGSAVLLFLLLSAQGRYATTREEYDQKATELARLQGLKPHPDQANLEKVAAQKGEYATAAIDLLEELAAMELPLKEVTPEEFQDKLKRAVTELDGKAAAAGTKLPQEFFLGFEDYRTQLPSREAAPKLQRQMEAIGIVCNILVDSKVSELKELKRPKLAVEGGTPAASAKSDASAGKGAAKVAAPSKTALPPMVEDSEFSIVFIADQTKFRRVINLIAAAREQFFVIRDLVVANQSQEGPSRLSTGAAAGAATPSPLAALFDGGVSQGGTAGTPTPVQKLEFLLGNEKVEVQVSIAIIDFADPEVVKAIRSGGEKKQAATPQK